MRLNSESIETILERFDRRDDADADYVMDWQRCVGQVLRGRVPVR